MLGSLCRFLCGASSPRASTVVALAQIAFAVAALAFAAWLHPDPRGFGTHEALGLAPCSFQARMGLPCPACGLTTSVAHAVRGDFGSAARAHLAGIPAVLWVAWLGVAGATRLGKAARPSARARAFLGAGFAVSVGLGVLATWLGRF